MAFTSQRFLNPARTEVSDANGWAATFTDGCRTVTIRGQPRSLVEQSAGITDQFARSMTNGWGNSPYGGKWFSIGGSPGNYATNGSAGTMKVAATGVAYRMLITNPHTDINAKVRLRSSGNSTGQGLQQGLLFSYLDSQNYYMAHMSAVPGNVTDNFGRAVTNGWGKSTSGQLWVTSGGAAADYIVGDSVGKHKLTAVNSSLRSLLNASRDFDCKVKIATDALAQGSSILTGILGRYQDANNYYNFRVRFSSAPASRPIFMAIQKQVGGTATTLGSEVAAHINHTANTFIWVRAMAGGSALKMKLWAYGTSEPTTWQLQITDTSFTAAGQAGVRSLLAAGNTNALPVTVAYDSLTLKLLNTSSGNVQVTLQKRVSGVTSTLGSSIRSLPYNSSDAFWLRVSMLSGSIKVRLWKDGTTEPTTWSLQKTDNTLPAGLVGLRSYCAADTPTLPVTFSFNNYEVSGTWPTPPTVTHSVWVRLLAQPFSGIVDETWLAACLVDNTPDILALSAQYITWAPPVTDPESGRQIAGDAQYSYLLPDGTRHEGADFNDYLGQDWQYTFSTDPADADYFKSLDCAGMVRMVYGYRAGYPLALSGGTTALPRSSFNLAYNAPGVILASDPLAPPTITAHNLKPGDMVYFCAPTSNPGEAESQVDHVGIYLGLDTTGKHRFISSRRAINGPTFADVGGPSTLNGAGQYPETFRLIRRL